MKIVIHGAGPSGCTAARLLAEKGHKITVLEVRDHIGGNTYDEKVKGVMVHMYGPHLFHTDNKEVVEFLSRFTTWRPYVHKVKAITNEGIIDLPIHDDNLFEDVSVTEHYADPYYYDLVYRDYSFKQWGYQPPKEVLDRVMIKCRPQDGYFTNKFQALPNNGYTKMWKKVLDHENITVELSCEGHLLPDCDLRVWTGKVDEYFNYSDGELTYRSLDMESYEADGPQEAVTVNDCTLNVNYTRITDYGMMMGKDIHICQAEYPCPYIKGVNEPYYPIGDNRYEDKQTNERVMFLGRLAEFKYYDMDKAIGNVIERIKDVD